MNTSNETITKSRLLILILLFLVILPPAGLFAEGEIITKLEVQGQRRIEESAILSNVRSRVGDYFSTERVSEDIKRIFKMGYFDDVKVDLSSGELGPQLTFIVKERPFIREIKIEGNKELKEEGIREVITVRESTIFNMDRVRDTKEKIVKLYEEKGFFLADISHRLDEKGDEAALIFEIAEGRKAKIRKVNILGNKEYSDKDLLGIGGVETKEGGAFSWLTDSGKFEEETLQKDIDLMRAFYYNNGFIQVKIEAPQAFMSPDKKWLYVTIRINEGDQFNVGEISFAGDLGSEPEATAKTKETLKTKEGETFSSNNMRMDIVTLTDKFGDIGYAFANVSPKTEIDEEKRLVNITFSAEKGSLVYIDRINITGNTKTRDKVVRRELKIAEGDLYNGSALRRSRQKVNNLGFFKEVNFATQRGRGEDKLDLNIEIDEGPTGTLTVGGGYSSIDHLVGMIQVSQGNLGGRGQKLSMNAEVGGQSSSYNLSFTEPYLFDKKVSAGFNIFNTTRDYSDYENSSKGGGVTVSVPRGEYSRASVRYRYEKVDISEVSPSAAQLILDSEGETTTSSILTSLSRDSRDNNINPTEGSVNSISLEYAGGLLGEDNNFYKAIVNTSWYYSVPWEHVLMFHGRAGYGHGFEGDTLKVDERFFLGGINTLRGYDYRSVGPEELGSDGNPYVVGGNKELLFNTEYIFPLSVEAGLKGLVFFDAGNVFDTGEAVKLSELRKSVGYGFRWFSPIGPLRLEWGYILDPKPGEKKSQWEFSIGTFF
ncbi:MAG: outer membrane protein assembly factor BamA [Proteobacteria bacterium]|nr:outer membrane protein assembly factor BamA [Pseudomonadota bacterium]